VDIPRKYMMEKRLQRKARIPKLSKHDLRQDVFPADFAIMVPMSMDWSFRKTKQF
jgi:hypothetical protein